MNKIIKYFSGLLCVFLIASCQLESKNTHPDKLNVVTTTTMITEMVEAIVGEDAKVDGLMGTGVDPHYYKATEGDMHKLAGAQIIFHNGLHLEGKMEQIFEKMDQNGVEVTAVTEGIDRSMLVESSDFQGNYDPHFWFDIDLWIAASKKVSDILSKLDAKNKVGYAARQVAYADSLLLMKQEIKSKLDLLPDSSKVLVTAHDAFSYFGRYFDIEVKGLQGITTTAEAGVKDVQAMSDFIVEREIKAIFVESSVSKRNIEALQKAVQSKGFDVIIGGELFSDALGNPDSPEGTYKGMYWHNVNTLVNALK